jgi:membrane-bound lytic murein transglycosylase D
MNRLAMGIRVLHGLVFVLTSLAANAIHADNQGLTGTPQIQPSLRFSYTLDSMAEDSVSPYKHSDLWARVRDGFKMPEVNSSLVQVHEQWYRAHPETLQRALERSRMFLYHIVDEVEKRGMPTEIALLPVIESAFNPQATSPRNASGIWQFMPATGKVYGLRQTAWYDGRRDVLEATRAALDYLEDLYAMFGRWDLALGAYNCGEGCMGRAVGKQGTSRSKADYASLNLPTETRHYVPKLIAVRNIIKQPERYGIALEDVANEPYFTKVSLNRHMDAQQVANLAGMSTQEVISLNPGFQRKVIRSDHPSALLLPADRVDTFTTNLKQQSGNNGLKPYAARKGESLSAIASKFGVSLDWLKSRNAISIYKGKLREPATVLVPGKASGGLTEAAGKLNTMDISREDTLSGANARNNG